MAQFNISYTSNAPFGSIAQLNGTFDGQPHSIIGQFGTLPGSPQGQGYPEGNGYQLALFDPNNNQIGLDQFDLHADHFSNFTVALPQQADNDQQTVDPSTLGNGFQATSPDQSFSFDPTTTEPAPAASFDPAATSSDPAPSMEFEPAAVGDSQGNE